MTTDPISLARRIVHEVAAARAAQDEPDAAVAAVAAAAEAAGELAGLLLGGASQLDARARFARLAETGLISGELGRRLRSLASFETFAYRQCKTALDGALLDLIVREELDPLLEFAALARRRKSP